MLITEEWQTIAPRLRGPASRALPVAEAEKMDPEADAAVEWLKGIDAVRTIQRDEHRAQQETQRHPECRSERDRELAQLCDTYLRSLAGIDSLSWLDGAEARCQYQVVGDMEVLVPMAVDRSRS